MLCPPYPFSTRFLTNRHSPDSANIIEQVIVEQVIIEQVIVGGEALSQMPTCGGNRQCCQIAALARQRVGLGSMGRTSSSIITPTLACCSAVSAIPDGYHQLQEGAGF